MTNVYGVIAEIRRSVMRTTKKNIEKKPRNAATKPALNPKAQGGDTCGFLGFPSGGHAHQTQRDIAGFTFIGSRTCWFTSISGFYEV